MKSLEGIRRELLDELQQTSDKYSGQIDKIGKEKDALLERAGATHEDVSSLLFPDTESHRSYLREVVFNVPDRELRREIMEKINEEFYEQWDHWNARYYAELAFVEKLRDDRCKLPELKISQIRLAAFPLIILCLTYLFDGALVALVAGAAAFFLVVPQIAILVVKRDRRSTSV